MRHKLFAHLNFEMIRAFLGFRRECFARDLRDVVDDKDEHDRNEPCRQSNVTLHVLLYLAQKRYRNRDFILRLARCDSRDLHRDAE